MKLNSEEALIRAALSEIETPAYEIERTVRNAMRQDTAARPRHFPRAALLAAALVAVLADGAAAVSISGLWTRFFPNPDPSSARPPGATPSPWRTPWRTTTASSSS